MQLLCDENKYFYRKFKDSLIVGYQFGLVNGLEFIGNYPSYTSWSDSDTDLTKKQIIIDLCHDVHKIRKGHKYRRCRDVTENRHCTYYRQDIKFMHRLSRQDAHDYQALCSAYEVTLHCDRLKKKHHHEYDTQHMYVMYKSVDLQSCDERRLIEKGKEMLPDVKFRSCYA